MTDSASVPPRPEQPSERNEETPDLLQGTIEIALLPPISFDQMIDVHRQLKELPGVDVLKLGGSVDEGITIRAYLASPTPLLRTFRDMPAVGEVSEELPSTQGRGPEPLGAEHPPVRRIVVATKP